MKLSLTINGHSEEIEIVSEAPLCRFRLGEGSENEADVQTPEPGVYSILMGGRSYDARVEESAAGLIVSIDGYRFEIAVRDPRSWTRGSAAAGADGLQIVAAPMPGKVVRVLVAAGDVVEPGDGLVVVEAMKMQNEMKAVRAGRVIAIAAVEGAAVAAGEPLITIE